MTSFAHVEYPTQHLGVVRAERAVEATRELARHFDGGRAGALLVLAVIVAAVLAVANVVETWTEGHLMAAWVVMWTVAFGALALYALPLRRAWTAVRQWLGHRAALRRQAAEDEKLWRIALTDERVMADLSRARSAAAALRNLKTYY